MTAADRFLIVSEQLRIPLADIRFRFSRSAGPGGQNVNKLSTRAMLLLDLDDCAAIHAGHRQKIQHRLATRIGRDGVLRVVSSRFRTQEGNRKAALRRLAELLADALAEDKPRIPTRVTRGAVKRRLRNKQHRSQAKQLRRSPSRDD